jgi:DnaJ-class molecular chaperone
MDYRTKCPDYYEELELSVRCTKDEIKKSFKRLAMIHHPDKGGNEEKFKKISQAYETLSDDQKRKEYDSRGQSQPTFENFRNSFGNGFDFMNQFFNIRINPGHGPGKRKLENINITLDFELKEAYLGCEKFIEYSNIFKCECYTNCQYCKGSGRVQKLIKRGPISQLYENACECCLGKGYSVKSDCSSCGETGRYEKIDKLRLVFQQYFYPKNITLKNKGRQAFRDNEESGDLIINVNIKNDKNFSFAEGRDPKTDMNLYYNIEIDFTDSICGKELTIPLFNNEIKINDTYEEFGIVENNKEYIIGKGLGFLKNENERANLIVKFKINYPTKKYTQTERNEIKKILQ